MSTVGAEAEPRGHLQVKGSARGARSYWAFWTDGAGKHGKRLGPAHVKDSGRRTARGAIVWRAGDGRKPSPDHLTPKEAQTELARILEAAPREQRARATGTLRDACEGWAAERALSKGHKRSTTMDYGDMFERLYRDFGREVPVAEVAERLRDLAQVGQDYIHTLKAQKIMGEPKARLAAEAGAEVVNLGEWRWAVLRPAAIKTKRKYRAILGAVLDYAVRRKWIRTNPIRDSERPGRDRAERRVLRAGDFYTPDEVGRLLAGAPDLEFRALFAVAAYAGLRLGEILDLRWGAVDFNASVIRVYDNWVRGESAGNPKDHESRHVPMSGPLGQLLARLKERGWSVDEGDLVFPSDARGEHLGEKRLRRVYTESQDAGGLKRVRFHDLRHTLGTTAARANIDLNTIREWLGHSSLAMVQIYAHYQPHDDEAGLISRAFATPAHRGGHLDGRALAGFDEELFFARLEEEVPATWLSGVKRAYEEACGLRVVAPSQE